MSEVGEISAAVKDANKEKKRKNQESSTQILIDKGVKFESKNGGNHLVVTGKESIIDFWPSTGKFITRNGKLKSGRGVFNLLKLCEKNE